MNKWERMAERIFVFVDADKRSRLTPEQLESCPTLGEILDAMEE